MTTPVLSGKQRIHLRGLGQRRDPDLKVGKDGLTPALLKELERCLSGRDLIKVRFLAADRIERQALCGQIAEQSSSLCVGAVGGTALFFRPHPDPLRSSLVA